MMFAEELGPVGWSAVAGSILAAVVATATSIFNMRRTAKKEDVAQLRSDEDRIITQQRDMYERAKKQWEDDRIEFGRRIDALEKRIAKSEKSFDRVKTMYVQEVARRKYLQGILRQHKIEIEEWDMSTAELAAFDSDLASVTTPPAPSPAPPPEIKP
jgi:heme exporter protein D